MSLINKKIFCIIPAFEEEKNIVKVINKILNLDNKDNQPLIDKIVVIDDGSSDQTYKLAKKIKSNRLTVLRHIINRDQGASLQTGNDYALLKKADIIVHFDADDQFVAEEINKMVEPIIKDNYDVVLGSRFLDNKTKMPKFKKNIIMPIARLVNKIFFNINLTDPQSGFRAMKRKVLEKIKIEQDGKAHCSEILYKIYKNKFKVKEVPITVIYHEFGQNFGGGVRIVKDFILNKLTQ